MNAITPKASPAKYFKPDCRGKPGAFFGGEDLQHKAGLAASYGNETCFSKLCKTKNLLNKKQYQKTDTAFLRT